MFYCKQCNEKLEPKTATYKNELDYACLDEVMRKHAITHNSEVINWENSQLSELFEGRIDGRKVTLNFGNAE